MHFYLDHIVYANRFSCDIEEDPKSLAGWLTGKVLSMKAIMFEKVNAFIGLKMYSFLCR